MNRTSVVFLMGALVSGGAVAVSTVQPLPQAAAQAAMPHQSGTVKSATADGFTLTNAAGQEITVSVPADAKVLVVAPGAKTLAGATAGSAADVAPGDRALVTGTPGTGADSLTAVRVILMKSAAIAETHAAEEAAWNAGVGGIVKSVDPASGTIVVSNGLRKVTVKTTPQTVVRRYAAGSVRFQDAVVSSLADVHPGDQIRVRGTKSADGSEMTADAIVAGTFEHYSGLLTAVDASAGTVTLKDLKTHRMVTVTVTPNSDVRELPAMLAERLAGHMRGGAGQQAAAGEHEHGLAGEGGGEAAHRASNDLSAMLSRLPTESLADLKSGDAVMIVATSAGGTPEAVTLLNGVEPLLTAPSGETMALSPWNVGGGGESDSEGGGGGS